MNTIIFSLIVLSAIVLIGTITLQSPKGKLTNSQVLVKNHGSKTANNIAEKTTWFAGSAILVLSFLSSFV
jgi:protein translocase SecG subunit